MILNPNSGFLLSQYYCHGCAESDVKQYIYSILAQTTEYMPIAHRCLIFFFFEALCLVLGLIFQVSYNQFLFI